MTAQFYFWKKNTQVKPSGIASLLATGFAQVIVLHLLTHNSSNTQIAVIARGVMLIFLPFLATYFSTGIAAFATGKLRNRMLQNLSHSGTNEIEQIHAHAFSKAVTQDVDLLFQFWKDFFGNVCFNLPILVYLAFLVLIQSNIFLVAGAVVILIILFGITFKINLRTRTKQREHHRNHIDLQSRIQNYINNIFQFRLYRNEENYLKKLNQNLADFSQLTAQLSQHRQLYTTYISAMLLLFFGGGLWLMRSNETIKPSDAAIATIVFIEIRRIVTEIFAIIQSYQKAQEAALHLGPWLANHPNFHEPEIKHSPFISISTQNLTFRYKENQQLITYPDIEIRAGERIWLKGPNGRGKSTFWKILTGLYTDKQTVILLNNLPEQSNGIRAFSKTMAAVTEPARSYNGKIWEIIGSFSKQREDVIDWLSLHHLLNEFDNYPFQLDTDYDSNVHNLSAGQLKWLLIVQAFYRNPDILILDEPFASLDINRQQLTLNLIHQLPRKTTLIVISHQDIPVSFDQIITLNNK